MEFEGSLPQSGIVRRERVRIRKFVIAKRNYETRRLRIEKW